MSLRHTVARLLITVLMASWAFTAAAADFAAALKPFDGATIQVRLPGSSGTTPMTLQEVGSDYIRLRKSEASNNYSIYFVPFATISHIVEVVETKGGFRKVTSIQLYMR